jgi:type VI secretion system secreted protein Hcp
MAADIFLKFEGPDLKGESVVDGHKEEIDVDSFAWGASNSSSMNRSGGGGVAKGDCQPLTVSGQIDKASPEFWKKVMQGEHFDKATLIARKAGGSANKQIEYFKMEMKKVYVASWQVGGSSNSGSQSMALTFNEVTVTYTPQTDKGGKGTPTVVSYNIAEMTD